MTSTASILPGHDNQPLNVGDVVGMHRLNRSGVTGKALCCGVIVGANEYGNPLIKVTSSRVWYIKTGSVSEFPNGAVVVIGRE